MRLMFSHKLLYFIIRCISALGLVLFTLILEKLYGIEFLGEITFTISLSILISVISRMGSEYSSYQTIMVSDNKVEVEMYFSVGILLSLLSSMTLSILVSMVSSSLIELTGTLVHTNLLIVLSISNSTLQFIATFKRSNSQILSSYILEQGLFYFLIGIILISAESLTGVPAPSELFFFLHV